MLLKPFGLKVILGGTIVLALIDRSGAALRDDCQEARLHLSQDRAVPARPASENAGHVANPYGGGRSCGLYRITEIEARAWLRAGLLVGGGIYAICALEFGNHRIGARDPERSDPGSRRSAEGSRSGTAGLRRMPRGEEGRRSLAQFKFTELCRRCIDARDDSHSLECLPPHVPSQHAESHSHRRPDERNHRLHPKLEEMRLFRCACCGAANQTRSTKENGYGSARRDDPASYIG
jgi:hypothetical protein